MEPFKKIKTRKVFDENTLQVFQKDRFPFGIAFHLSRCSVEAELDLAIVQHLLTSQLALKAVTLINNQKNYSENLKM